MGVLFRAPRDCSLKQGAPSYLVLKTANVTDYVRMRSASESREPESNPRPCKLPLLRMACASASATGNGRESAASAFRWSVDHRDLNALAATVARPLPVVNSSTSRFLQREIIFFKGYSNFLCGGPKVPLPASQPHWHIDSTMESRWLSTRHSRQTAGRTGSAVHVH
jgi:hypothetical protein